MVMAMWTMRRDIYLSVFFAVLISFVFRCYVAGEGDLYFGVVLVLLKVLTR